MPEWADWFAEELNSHRAIIDPLVIGCNPAIVKGEKEQFLDWRSWGVETDAITFPKEAGSVHSPSFGLKDIFLCQ
jgi:hypothetical protein